VLSDRNRIGDRRSRFNHTVSKAVTDWEPTSDEATSTVMLRAVKKK